MEAGGRCAASLGGTLKPPIASGMHDSMSCSEDEETGIYLLNYATQIGTIKNILLSGAFLSFQKLLIS